MSQAMVGASLSWSHNKVGRLERAELHSASVTDIARLAAVLGLELGLKLYPDGPPIRDAAHLALLSRLRSMLGPGITMRIEVPIPMDGDRRAWDAMLEGRDFRIAVEAETRLHDVQALMRRISLKQRDARVPLVVLAIAATHTHRRLLREFDTALRVEFPLGTKSIARALRAGTAPGGSGVLII